MEKLYIVTWECVELPEQKSIFLSNKEPSIKEVEDALTTMGTGAVYAESIKPLKKKGIQKLEEGKTYRVYSLNHKDKWMNILYVNKDELKSIKGLKAKIKENYINGLKELLASNKRKIKELKEESKDLKQALKKVS